MRTPTPDEFDEELELTARVTGQSLPSVNYDVDPEQLGDPKGGPDEIDRRISCVQLLAKLPPAQVVRFVKLLNERTPRARQARRRLRLEFLEIAKRFGITNITDVI